MVTKLLIISDLWGAKRGPWITSYLGYLQQYYDISFYDSQQLANIDVAINSDENILEAFLNGGIDTAVAHLLKKETEPVHILGFGIGATIAWRASLKGMNLESIYAISPVNIKEETKKPGCEHYVLFGEYDFDKPTFEWADKLQSELEIYPNFGKRLYSDEKIIQKVAQDLLGRVLRQAS